MRASIIAKAGTATAALLAATGGLAAAHALPAPVQDAVSHIGIGSPANSGGSETPSVDDATTTGDPASTTIADDKSVPDDATPTTAEPVDNQGDGTTPTSMHVDLGDNNQSEVDNNQGDNNQSEIDNNQGDNNQNEIDNNQSDNNQNEIDNNQSGDNQDNSGDEGHDSTPPTTVDPATTPTTEMSDSDSNHGDHSGDSHPSELDQDSGSDSSGND